MTLAHHVTRREFVKSSALLGAAAAATSVFPSGAWAAGTDRLRVGVIGCGGRGTGAAADILAASSSTQLVALGDVFQDRIDSCRSHLAALSPDLAQRATVDPERCFTGFDAYKSVLAAGIDIAILATPPHFRPIHLAAAIDKGCHVFMEKPVAVDPAGVRSVLASAAAATGKRLSIVAGTQRRHEACYLDALRRLHNGDFGRIVDARCYWNQGGLWMHKPRAEWSDMEWQLRNWLYFAWLSGDHIVEQHVHNLDVINWAIGAAPLRCMGMGGRQVRTHPDYGHIFDHFAIEYEYPGGVRLHSFCRQIDGCATRVEEAVHTTHGVLTTRSGFAAFDGAQDASRKWGFRDPNPNPYVEEHKNLLKAITSATPLNEAKAVAEATLTAIMGRMSAYTGQEVTWEKALASTLDLSPPAYEFGTLPVPPVAIPGRTPLV